ncbi:MAG: PAS domain S-box protein [Melioribacteraceae bacterium]|nr:PAS domain S-box protein [Melioribacteraceae bacterium]
MNSFENKYKTLFQKSADAILIIEGNLFVEVNNATLKMFAVESEAEFLNTHPSYFSPEFQPDGEKSFEKTEAMIGMAIENGSHLFEWIYKKRNGETFLAEVSLTLISKDEETPIVHSIVRDLSERLKTAENLEKTQEKYKLILDLAPNGFFHGDTNGNFITVNDKAIELTQYSRNELLNMNMRELFSNDVLNEKPLRYDLLKEGKTVTTERSIKRKDGKNVLIEMNSKMNPDGTMQAFFIDITKRKENEKALKESEELFRNLSNYTSSAIFIYQDDLFVFVNKSAEKLTGYSREELIGMNFWNVVHPDFLTEAKQRGKSRQKGEKVTNRYEFKIIKKDGSIIWIDYTAGTILWNGKNAALGTAIDITKTKESAELLKENEEKYRLIASLTSDYIFSVNINKDGKKELSWVAGSLEEITGYDLESYKKAGGWQGLLHPEDIEKDNSSFNRLLQNERVVDEVRTYKKDGSLCWVRSMGYPIWNEKENRVTGIVGAVTDITKEKRDRNLQQIQYNIARSVVSSKSLTELFIIVKQELNNIFNTKNFYIALYNEETDSFYSDVIKDEKDDFDTWKAKGSLSGYLLDSKKTLRLLKKEILELAQEKKIEIIGTMPEIWIGVPLVSPHNKYGVMVVQDYENCCSLDQSTSEILEVIGHQLSLYLDRKKTEETANKLSKAIVQSPIGVTITDPNGKIQFVNPNYCKMSGYSEKELIGKNTRILKSGKQSSEFYKTLWQTLLSGKDWYGEFQNKSKSGEIYWESAVISPILDEENNITNFLSIKEDITEKKQMLEELILSKEKAESSEKIKTEFLAQMSHEIRSPLNVILNFMSLIKEDISETISEDIKFGFASIDSASKRIIRTIDQILNMSDLQLGTYDLITKPIDLMKDIFDSLLKEYKYLLDEKGLKCSIYLKCDSGIVIADEYSINQVFANLIDNAIKYTNEGSISILLYRNEKDNLVVKITDTGIGIAEDYLPNIFEAFLQEEQGYSRQYEGNGLGLSLVKNYCELNNSEIDVESKKGVGTTFTVTFSN